MTGHTLPESTNACPTSPTTDIQPEMPETQLGHVIGACSEDDGVPDIGVSIGLGEGSMLWLGELLKRDGADIGFVFHGADGKRIVAPIWPNCEWQDVADLLRHHVAPILARLTSTTPILGDMEPTDAMLRAGYEKWEGGSADECKAIWCAMNAAAPASPIPISVNGAGEREEAQETIRDALMDSQFLAGARAGWNAAQTDDPEAALAALLKSREGHLAGFADAKRTLALSPALDNTDNKRTIEILSRALAWHGDPQRMATTREEWQQTIDTAIAWVKANPEPGRVSFSSFTHAPWHHDETIEQYRERMTGSPTLDNTAVEGRQALALRNIEAAITQSLRDWEGSTRGDAFSVALSIVQRERAALSAAETEKAR